ncbi:peroxiredoxin family protein [candidate division WWE3 bacterium]|nr:peroxiredoxin family protein [candidate division WWE3 bacterium]
MVLILEAPYGDGYRLAARLLKVGWKVVAVSSNGVRAIRPFTTATSDPNREVAGDYDIYDEVAGQLGSRARRSPVTVDATRDYHLANYRQAEGRRFKKRQANRRERHIAREVIAAARSGRTHQIARLSGTRPGMAEY